MKMTSKPIKYKKFKDVYWIAWYTWFDHATCLFIQKEIHSKWRDRDQQSTWHGIANKKCFISPGRDSDADQMITGMLDVGPRSQKQRLLSNQPNHHTTERRARLLDCQVASRNRNLSTSVRLMSRNRRIACEFMVSQSPCN